MFEAKADKAANLLMITYAGRVGADEAAKCEAKIGSLLAELTAGFRMLTDLRQLEAMDLECVPFIERVMDACDDYGIKLVVRVIPDPRKDIGLNIMSLFHYGRGVKIVTCKTLEEAEKRLGL